MTPKEKAEELVDKYDGLLTYIESKGKAKQCALFTVEEILDSNMIHLHLYQMDYWAKVKQEIRKL
jgi:hypothetical protein